MKTIAGKNPKNILTPEEGGRRSKSYRRLRVREFFRSRSCRKKFSKFLECFKDKNGLEIGGPSDIFSKTGILRIYPMVANLDGCNFAGTTVWEGNIEEGIKYKYQENKKEGYQFICDAVDLAKIRSGTYDFILASHIIEHIANPFKAMSEWLRVLREEGVLLMVIPLKDGTFDHKRPLTPLGHLAEDRKNNIRENDLTHLPEILELHDLRMDPPAGGCEAFKKRSLNNYENRCLHHHIFDTKLAAEIFNYFGLQILFVDTVLPCHIIILGKKCLNGDNVHI